MKREYVVYIEKILAALWARIIFIFSKTSVSNDAYVGKLVSLDYAELVHSWAKTNTLFTHFVVLTNLNLSVKGIRFWTKIPKVDMHHFLKDVVVLRCKDKSEVLRLVENTGLDFADAQGYAEGMLVATNKEEI